MKENWKFSMWFWATFLKIKCEKNESNAQNGMTAEK